jgi:hypothetical protein
MPCAAGSRRVRRRDLADTGADRVAAGNRQHIPDTAVLQGLTQFRVRAVDLVTGDPARSHAGVQGAGDHLGRQRWLGRELHRRRDTSLLAPVGVIGPDPRQIQLPVDQRVPVGAGIRQIHRDLGVLDPPGGPGVLTLHPNGVSALLEVAGLVHHQHGIHCAEPLHDIPAQVITDAVGVPRGLAQQVLQAIRRVMAGVFSQRPAVLHRQPRHQPRDRIPRQPPRLHPREPRRDPRHQPIELHPPTTRVYALARGHREIFLSPHNPRSSSGGRLTSGTATPPDHELRLSY